MYLSREDVVSEFHKAFGHPLDKEMTVKDLDFRYRLLFEEFTELKEEVAAAMADIDHYGKAGKKTKERLLLS